MKKLLFLVLLVLIFVTGCSSSGEKKAEISIDTMKKDLQSYLDNSGYAQEYLTVNGIEIKDSVEGDNHEYNVTAYIVCPKGKFAQDFRLRYNANVSLDTISEVSQRQWQVTYESPTDVDKEETTKEEAIQGVNVKSDVEEHQAKKFVGLEDMTSIERSYIAEEAVTDNYGNVYDKASCNNGGTDIFQYLLDNKYEKFTGTLFIKNGESSNYNNSYLKIIADGNEIYTSPYMSKTSKPVEIDVNVIGYNDVQIKICTNDTMGNNLTVCLGNARFYKK